MPEPDKLHAPLRRPGGVSVFALPRGHLGVLAGWVMARTSARHNAWAVGRMDVQAGDRCLEIGFGPGLGLRLLAERASAGWVAGIDPSAEMVRMAGRRNAPAIAAGRMELQTGTVAGLPYPDGRFDHVLSVNNVMLWPGPEASLREVARVLRPGGTLLVALNPVWAKTPADTRDMGREIQDLLAAAGFRIRDVAERGDFRPAGAVAVLAEMPG